ncbi:MAG: hypothetical protein ACYTGF_08295, partial [Planctomycetota bacterium]
MARNSPASPTNIALDPRGPARAAVNWVAASSWRGFWIIFVLAFVIRIFLLTRVSAGFVRPHARMEA